MRFPIASFYQPTGTGCAQLALELRHPQPSELFEAGRSLLDDLRERQILLGTRRL